ncbi:PEP-CTERM sorting domain-containing protein [Pseudoduganella lutea]|nr:PEP-CTERM sorting domain-containing protein [Pseudoduganella lutea]
MLPDLEGKILNLDNLALAVSPVPEPSQLAMLAGGMLLLDATLRRRG